MLEIGGPLAGTDYDVLDVSGDVLLGGIVALVFLDGYAPEMGTQFDLLRFGGSFDATQATFYVAGAPAGLQYAAFTRDGIFGLEIGAIPEPASAVLLLIALLATFRTRHRLRQGTVAASNSISLGMHAAHHRAENLAKRRRPSE